MNIKNLSKFGRSFSLLRIPYSFKLLIQELQVMNIQMRIITDENVDQLLSMSYSNNINKLLHDSKSQSIENTDALIKEYAKKMAKVQVRSYEGYKIEEKPEIPIPVEEEDIQSPILKQEDPSKLYNPESQASPAYAPYSPAYNPEETQVSPAYAPYSPAYNPESPQYPDVSPAYNPEETKNAADSSSTNVSILDVPNESGEKKEKEEVKEDVSSTSDSGDKKVIETSSDVNTSSDIKKIII
jgi:hypothetical protein